MIAEIATGECGDIFLCEKTTSNFRLSLISSAGAPPEDVMESAETPDEGGHPPDDEVGSHHSPPDDVFR